MSESVPQKLGWLKFAVIFMGILLIVGTGVIVVTIIRRLAQPAITQHEFPVSVPAGAQILESNVDQNRLVLRLRTDQGDEIRIFDLAAGGKELSRVRLVPAQ